MKLYHKWRYEANRKKRDLWLDTIEEINEMIGNVHDIDLVDSLIVLMVDAKGFASKYQTLVDYHMAYLREE